jgi:hypothetical protein
MICTVINASRPKLMPIAGRVRGPISASRKSRIAALCSVQPKPSWASKLPAPKIPEARQEHLHDDADRDQEREPVVGGGHAAAH